MNGSADPHTSIVQLSREGARLLQTNQMEEAGALLRQALARSRDELGGRHATTADCLNNLGEWQRLRRQWGEAEQSYGEALAIRSGLSGPDSPETGPLLNNLALLLRQTGRLTEAEPLLRRALGLSETRFGPRHPNVAIALHQLARLLELLGRAREAEPLARRQVAIFEEFHRATGEQHAQLFPARRSYFDLLGALGFRSRTAQVRLRTLTEGGDPGALPEAEPALAGQPDFDALARAAHAPRADRATQDALHAAAFRLPRWLFIARGAPPDLRPYLAANPALVDSVPMLKAFTEAERLQLFARDHALTSSDGSLLILSLPVATIEPWLDELAQQGVTHLHFNADDCSDGFYVPLRQVPVIRRHLQSEGLL